MTDPKQKASGQWLGTWINAGSTCHISLKLFCLQPMALWTTGPQERSQFLLGDHHAGHKSDPLQDHSHQLSDCELETLVQKWLI